MSQLDPGIADCRALVVDGNPTSRSTIVSQLRDYGVTQVAQANRPTDARRMLEFREFDIVLCEQRFPDTTYSGQELLDDLRRAQLLPFGTVFVMLTGEASYAQVAEAAESALDSYMLKPHTAAALGQRLKHARHRKKVLSPIFEAIEAGEFETAAQLCLARYQAKQHYWLYAARIGAELLLRLERPAEAQKLFKSILDAQALPWAKLGVARAELDSGQPNVALSTLQSLATEQPGFADAYDVMGRIHVEQGHYEQALAVYRQACDITPSSIARLQKRGMLAFYMGHKEEAAKALDRATLLGLSSKMYDHQSLMLLTFTRYQMRDTQGVRRCIDQLQIALEKRDHAPRLRRFKAVAQTLLNLMSKQVAAVVADVKQHAAELRESDFDVEAACNFVSLLTEVTLAELSLDGAPGWMDTLALRFCSTRTVTELMAGAAQRHPPFAAQMQEGHRRIGEMAQQAMSHAIAGNPRAAVKALITHGGQTLNTKLMDIARLTLQRHHERIEHASDLEDMVQTLLSRYAPSSAPPALGSTGRSAGGLSLRTSAEMRADAEAAKAAAERQAAAEQD
ncbi:MAG TPA: response regulator [Burkholderiaceae bacterium]|nr:response regulator [Burkholderiaceae bacterium]